MNILFLTISQIDDISRRGIYTDLMRELASRGNKVYIACPTERRNHRKTNLINSENCRILQIKTLNIQKTNVIEKGIGTLLLESRFDKAIRRYWADVKFDMVVYSTPPITFNKVIERIKKKHHIPSYLMLKDIFPQNAVDLGMMKEGSLLHRMFRKKERKLYNLSDTIGCMSPANEEYLLRNNPEINPEKVEICPNALMPVEVPEMTDSERNEVLKEYNIPTNKKILIYGGNLGRPQGIDFILKVLGENEKRSDSFIVIVGNGTEFPKVKSWYDSTAARNSILIKTLPKEKYERLVRASDVGLIFLDNRFTIPNFPSRLLNYLEYSKPVLCATDDVTDIGRIAEKEEFGISSGSGNIEDFKNKLELMLQSDLKKMGEKGRAYFLNNFTVAKVADKLSAKLH